MAYVLSESSWIILGTPSLHLPVAWDGRRAYINEVSPMHRWRQHVTRETERILARIERDIQRNYDMYVTVSRVESEGE